jgi:hypothetical protein
VCEDEIGTSDVGTVLDEGSSSLVRRGGSVSETPSEDVEYESTEAGDGE